MSEAKLFKNEEKDDLLYVDDERSIIFSLEIEREDGETPQEFLDVIKERLEGGGFFLSDTPDFRDLTEYEDITNESKI